MESGKTDDDVNTTANDGGGGGGLDCPVYTVLHKQWSLFVCVCLCKSHVGSSMSVGGSFCCLFVQVDCVPLYNEEKKGFAVCATENNRLAAFQKEANLFLRRKNMRGRRLPCCGGGVRSSGGFCLRDCFFFVVVEEEEDGDDGVDFGNVKTTGLDVRFVVLAFVVVVVVVVDLSIAALLTGPRVSCSSSS